MEGGAVGHNFERDTPKDHPSQVWFNLVQGFQRRRFKCESLRRTTDRRRTPSDGKRGELKIKEKTVISTEMVDILLVIWPVITVYGIQ
jgi:hypothetical protein